MSENPTQVLTSADIKKQIDAATKEAKHGNDLKESSIPLTGMIAAEINATEKSITEEAPTTASKPQPAVTAAEKVTGQSNGSVDSKEWAKKKWSIDGDFQSADEILEALRKRDQQYHKDRPEQKAKEGVPPAGFQQQSYAPPAYQPPVYQPQYGYQQPQAYQPIPNPRAILEDLARQNNMLPEDFERVAKVSRAVYDAAAEQDRRSWQGELDRVKLDNQKNNVFRELASDPVFQRQDVRAEYAQVLEQMQNSDPQSFERDPEAYKRAFDRSLQNIARKQFEGRSLTEGVPPVALPTTPPRPLGQGSGGGAMANESGFDRNAWDKKSLKEKAADLDRLGLRTTY